jgi:hypothetical protein
MPRLKDLLTPELGDGDDVIIAITVLLTSMAVQATVWYSSQQGLAHNLKYIPSTIVTPYQAPSSDLS